MTAFKKYAILKETGVERMKRFRGAIYVDVFVENTGTLEEQREKAYSILKEHTDNIPNAFTGIATLQTKEEMWKL